MDYPKKTHYAKQKQLLFAFAPLLLLILAFSYVQKTERPSKGYTIESRRYKVKANGETVEVGTQSTHISKNGNWRKVERNTQNRVTQVVVADATKDGIFMVDSEYAKRLSPYKPSPVPTAQLLRSNPDFFGEVSFLGQTAYAARSIEDGKVAIETISLPGIVPWVKLTIYDEDGSAIVTEAVSIVEGEPLIDQVRLPANLQMREALLDTRSTKDKTKDKN